MKLAGLGTLKCGQAPGFGCGGLGSGGALVPVGPVPDYATWSTGGPIRHGNANVVGNKSMDVYADAGLANDFENEPGALWTGQPIRFYENGVMTPLSGFGDAAVSSATVMPPVRLRVTSAIGATTTMAIGAGFGAFLAPNRRILGTLAGALAGGILGVIFSAE